MALYRDSKGRIRNSDKITPENQERLYRGEPLEIKPVFTKVFNKKTTSKKVINGKEKTVVKFNKVVKYVDSNGKFVSKKEFNQFNYIRNLNPLSKQVVRNFEVTGFEVLSELTNKLITGNSVKYNGKDFTPDTMVDLIKDIREFLENDSDNIESYIFDIDELENGNIEIFRLKDEENENAEI